jgi:2-(1,2-epoxy-1,2-dihydrophenyl)acetyl-CoA isomerase
MGDAPSYATLLYEVREHVAHITLNRPEVGNALDQAMARDLYDAALRCAGDPDVRAVILTGAGNAFCVGGDLKSFLPQGEAIGQHLKEVITHFHGAVSTFARMDAPVIAAINGVAAGGGLSLACAPDLAIAAESARFTMAYTRIGLAPDGGGSFALPRLIGLRRALDLALTNRMFTAAEALEWGMVARVVPDDQLAAEAAALAAQLATGSRGALAAAKRLMRSSLDTSLETQLAAEGDAIAACAQAPDGREGIAAFLEKRPPRFTGR